MFEFQGCVKHESVLGTHVGKVYTVVPHLLVFFFSNSLNGNLIKPEEAKVFEDEKRIVCFWGDIFSWVGLGPGGNSVQSPGLDGGIQGLLRWDF